MLFITYNCDLDFRRVEDEPIRGALSSLVAKGHDLA
jgi:hypothetical protein